MISARKAEFTFCQMITTQWKHLGQKPGGSVISSGESQSMHTILNNNYTKEAFAKRTAQRASRG